ncbi:hypothetical protein GDO86_019627 [Hymenochirus boettgeri]|uniref:Uncharacterized protein n=1 Tax=Hymenochirus boettgeri TaxID=247094 RepID=A0A8T2IIR2_9PIPI|nr:hypothetical protein GDO86_019627 [Hymenochirus boettgeri]
MFASHNLELFSVSGEYILYRKNTGYLFTTNLVSLEIENKSSVIDYWILMAPTTLREIHYLDWLHLVIYYAVPLIVWTWTFYPERWFNFK